MRALNPVVKLLHTFYSFLFKGGFINEVREFLVKLYLKRKHAKVDYHSLEIYGWPIIDISKNTIVEIGKGFIVRSNPYMSMDNSCCSKIVVNNNAILKIGNFSGMSNTIIYCQKEIIIGDYVNIGAGCLIMDSNFHSTNWHDRLDRKKDIDNRKMASVHIGNVAFIGARSIICKGVHIGNHAMIAAGSVVVTDVPDNELWGGNPAKFIKRLE